MVHWGNFFSFFQKTSSRIAKAEMYVSTRKLEGKYFCEKFECVLFFFRNEQKILAFCQVSFDWIVKNVFYEPKGTIWRKIFSRKIENFWVFNFFSDFDQKKKSALREAFFDRVRETAFLRLSINNFWRELFEKKYSLSFLDKEQKIFTL